MVFCTRVLTIVFLVGFLLANAQAKTDPNILIANDKIESFVVNKQYKDAFTYCNVSLGKNQNPQFNYFLQAAKLRLFVKARLHMDSIPDLYFKLQRYKSSHDSLDCFLNARITEIYGHYWYIKSDVDQALSFLHQADSCYNGCNSLESRVYNLNMIGNILKRQNKYSDALLALLRAEDLVKNNTTISQNVKNDLKNDIGLVYYGLGDYEKAKTYYQNLNYDLLTPLQVANAENNLGIIFLSDNKDNTAIPHFRRAAREYEKLEKWDDLAATYNNLGSAYDQKYDKPDSALYYLDLAIKLSVFLKDSANTVSPLINYASIQYRQENYKACLASIQNLSAYKHLFRLTDKSIFYQLTAITYEKLKNPKLALENYKLYHLYSDSLKNQANSAELARAENAFQIEKQQKDIADLNRQKLISETKQLQTRMMSWFIGFIGFLIIMSLTVLLNHFYKKQKLQEKIRRRELRLASMKSLMEGQEKERARMAKDLHDSVGNNLALLKAEATKNEYSEAKDYMLKLISQTADDVRNITHNLMPPVLLKIGLQAALRDMVSLWRHSSDTIIDLNISETFPELEKETQLAVFRIIQEMIKNALEHGKADYVLIKLNHDEDSVFLDFEDNGSGIDSEKMKEKTGLGLQNIKHRITLLNGKMDLSSDASGCKFSINFSIKPV